MRRRGVTFLQVAILIVLIGVVISTGLYLAWKEELASKASRRTSAPPPGVLLLPRGNHDVTEILLHTREDVRTALGEPSSETADADAFHDGLLRVSYVNGIAQALAVEAPGVVKNERAVRRWLKIPANDPAVIGERRLVIEAAAEGPEALEIGVAPEKVAPAPRPVRTGAAPATTEPALADPMPKVSTQSVLRAFPAAPTWLATRCERRAVGATIVWSCPDVVDAKLEWETDAAGSFAVLTLLAVKTGPTELECRKYLEVSAGGLSGAARTEGPDGVTGRYRSGSLEYLYSWQREAGSGACSLQACRANAGGEGGACRAR